MWLKISHYKRTSLDSKYKTKLLNLIKVILRIAQSNQLKAFIFMLFLELILK